MTKTFEEWKKYYNGSYIEKDIIRDNLLDDWKEERTELIEIVKKLHCFKSSIGEYVIDSGCKICDIIKKLEGK